MGGKTIGKDKWKLEGKLPNNEGGREKYRRRAIHAKRKEGKETSRGRYQIGRMGGMEVETARTQKQPWIMD